MRSDDSQFLTDLHLPERRRNPGAPFVGAEVASVPREQPVVALKVLDSVLAFTVFGNVKSLNDFGAGRLGPFKVDIDILEEDGEALRAVAERCGAAGAGVGLIHHDPGIAYVQLCSADWIAVAIVFDEGKCFGEPGNGRGKILILDVRQNRIWRHGAILKHSDSSPRPESADEHLAPA